ncbi:MAG: DUF4430 domain-containing protein [Clostridiales bacterium]|jgi:hypothetical protein|nr:DUF4430 domain-containing protein [Clostridiales bacterium]
MKRCKTTERRIGNGCSVLLCLLIVLVSLTGCKVEWPEEVLESNAPAVESLSSRQLIPQPDAESRWEASASELSAPEEPSASQSASSSARPLAPLTSQSGENSSRAATSSGKDAYQTDPVPQGKPGPVEPEDQPEDTKKQGTVTFSIVCTAILDNMDQFNMDKISVLPRDGVIYSARKVVFYEGESVFDVLLRETKRNGIHMEFRSTPMYNSNYIRGIHNLYEFDCGETSGWMYRVNGWFPNYGCSRYSLKDGDVVEWIYTCDLGKDVGCDWMEEGLQGGNEA